ncbi:D-alanyl-D-alanine carboxypeptidase/D-alanyl-D-alanine-endopeptidase (penicillin-binding protein 4) [Herbihabitans rhizosphaerae]|uniref:D-alanyl-D-alanine carboxypeptidase/D-alanyl-D-alanine-endopeptidase (Penicillin-binding protein 4) n=1 Tax=Herbihabitans rhizosphaerae TaxID=1872711 RepID=A0A4Q7KX05_9PSEU|nr:D-alanyl-D-alanine carboxypeptidase/D-alanyl-D-alanine-endopeptidase [Herbihabitans rhizosphaerae]RZS41227.1 D-alanyl-D-alanine carboxypeptidase/D-alanyl-D-alanine-endopeptidase (penicillin-binding protein 4) [Herbihabitans rhizosphaerae]
MSERSESDSPLWPSDDEDIAGDATGGSGRDEEPTVPAPDREATVPAPGHETMRLPVPTDRNKTTRLPIPPREPQPARQVPVPPRPEAARDPHRAAPMRIEATGEQPRVEVDEPVRRRGRKPLIVLVVLVLIAGAGAGVVFGVPGVKEKLGLVSKNDESPQPVAPPPAPIEFTPALRALDPAAPTPTGPGVSAALGPAAANPALGTLTGAVIDPATNTVLWQQNGGAPMIPASTAKVLTSAAALLAVDHGYQFTTTVVEGDKPGTVVLVGGGDITLSSLPAGQETVYPGAAHLDDLVAQVKAATGGKVDNVLVDLGRYAGPSLAPGWFPQDIAGGYLAPMVPVMLDGARLTKPAFRDSPRSDNPSRQVAGELAKRLGAQVPPSAAVTAPAGARVLGTVRSAPLVEVVDNLLLTSDNLLAEAVAREVAKVSGEEVSFAGGARATLEVLRRNGFDVGPTQLSDASGLSVNNRVSASLLAQVLAVAAAPDGRDPRTAKLRPLLGGLPVAGGSGTLAKRYQTPPSTEGKGWVRAKTGTLTGTNAVAGTVLDADGRTLVFALVSAGPNSDATKQGLDNIATALRQCGCR